MRLCSSVLLVVLVPAMVVAQSAAPASPALKGTFAGTFQGDAITLTLTEKTATVADAVGTTLVVDRITVKGNTMETVSQSGPIACDPALVGKYTWALSSKQLTFKVIEDACQGRSDALTSQTWTLVKAGAPAGSAFGG